VAFDYAIVHYNIIVIIQSILHGNDSGQLCHVMMGTFLHIISNII